MEGNTEFREPQQEQLKQESQRMEAAEAGWLRRQKERFNRVFSRRETLNERKQGEQLPKISIDIFYSPHGSPEDREGIRDYFEKADIYIPEFGGWSKNTADIYKDVSAGVIEPKDALNRLRFRKRNNQFYSMYLDELRMIYRSGKAISFIDIPRNNRLFKEYRRIVLDYSFDSFDSTFDKLFVVCKDFGKSFGEFSIAREDYILSQLKPMIIETVNADPNLKNKSAVSVLMSLGYVHTPVFRQLTNEGEYDVDKVMDSKSFGFLQEIIRREMFGKEINDTLVARVVAERLFEPIFREKLFSLMGNRYEKLSILNRKLFSSLSFEEIRDLVNGFFIKRREIKRNFLYNPRAVESESKKSLIKLFDDRLQEKGVQIPLTATKQELDAFLAKPAPKINIIHNTIRKPNNTS